MTDKEIIINGAIFNKCDGCPLYDGDICTGARLDEETSKKDTNICNEHLAEQFWVVFKQLKRKEQECEEYANKVEYIHAFLKDPHNYGSFKPMWGSFLLHWLFNENLGDFFPQEAYEMTDTITEKEKQIIKYKQALDEIENYVRDNSDFDQSDKLASHTGAYDILDIINKTKGE